VLVAGVRLEAVAAAVAVAGVGVLARSGWSVAVAAAETAGSDDVAVAAG
jgi:hypothetical protein